MPSDGSGLSIRSDQRGDGLRRNRTCKGQGGRQGEIKMATPGVFKNLSKISPPTTLDYSFQDSVYLCKREMQRGDLPSSSNTKSKQMKREQQNENRTVSQDWRT